MKKSILFASIILAGTLMAATSKNTIETQHIEKSNIVSTVKMKQIHNGKISTKSVYIVKTSAMHTLDTKKDTITYAFADGTTFNSKSEIMIRFTSEVDPKAIAKKYNLKFERKMNSGDYLFSNSQNNTLDVINTIISNEAEKVKTISPNVIFNMQAM